MKFLEAISFVLLLVSASEGQKLQQYCKFSPQHTLCRTSGIGKTCGKNVPSRGVSDDEIAKILAEHNQLRSKLSLGKEKRGQPGPQPNAADMMQMQWDEELAIVAQRHADQCIFEHECADCRKVERFEVGQNLYITFESDQNSNIEWHSAMLAWYDEVALYNSKEVGSYNFSPATGHYTQLVWSTTRYVGCGFTMYKEGGWYKKLYTCNYGPGGNILFTPMYKVGKPCSACPAGTSCSLEYQGLCTPNSASNGQIPNQSISNSGSSNARGKKIQSGFSQQFDIIRTQSGFVPSDDSGFPKFGGQGGSVFPGFGSHDGSGFNGFGSHKGFGQGNSQITYHRYNSNSNQASQNSHKKESSQTFFMQFGKDSQVIRTDSLDSVKAIVNALPKGSQPLVFYRTNMGSLRQLKNIRPQPSNSTPSSYLKRTIRSTATPSLQTSDPKQSKNAVMLSCLNATKPCPVVALSGNWTHGEDANMHVIRSLLSPSMGGQIVLGQTISSPRKEAVCVTLSHTFKGPQNNLPQVHVGVWPLGHVLLQEEASNVKKAEDKGWMTTKVSFAPIRKPFMVVLSVDPNTNPQVVKLSLRGFLVTEGLCN